MKILFVYNFNYPDYLADGVYHGLIDSGHEVYETHYPGYMLKSYENLHDLPGHGFTLYGKLEHTPKLENSDVIIEKIKSKFYDIVIYGCVYTHLISKERQCLDYLDVVREFYPRSKVHFLDGSDERINFAWEYNLNSYGIIWKRELTSYGYGNPISLAIPESQITTDRLWKQYMFSPNVPAPIPYGATQKKYAFTDEKSYYEEYQKSYYAHTCKKMGWDCLRHYEILANRCIPYFIGLEDCPDIVMTNFPKNIILEVNNYSRYARYHPYHEDVTEYIFSYTQKNLTTKKMIERFL